jgi:hypothetical protein
MHISMLPTAASAERLLRNAAGDPPNPGDAEPAAAPAPAAEPADPPAATPDDGPDLSWLPDQYRPEGADPDFEKFRQDYDDIQAQLAALSDGIPEAATDYAMAMPEDLDFGEIAPPDWFEFNLDAENPLVGELQSFMHENRMPADRAPQLVGMLAKYEAGKAAQYQADSEAQMKELGPQAQARIDRITRAVETRIPDKGQRAALLGTLVSAHAVRAVETLLSGTGASKSTTPTPPNPAVNHNANPMDRLIAAREAT